MLRLYWLQVYMTKKDLRIKSMQQQNLQRWHTHTAEVSWTRRKGRILVFFLEAGDHAFHSCPVLSNLKMTGFSSLPNLTTAAKTTLPVREIMRKTEMVLLLLLLLLLSLFFFLLLLLFIIINIFIIIFIIIIFLLIIIINIIIYFIIIRYFEAFSMLFLFFSNCDYTGNAEKWWLGFLGSPKMNGIVI